LAATGFVAAGFDAGLAALVARFASAAIQAPFLDCGCRPWAVSTTLCLLLVPGNPSLLENAELHPRPRLSRSRASSSSWMRPFVATAEAPSKRRSPSTVLKRPPASSMITSGAAQSQG
jgi:hypothetical protein